MSSLRPEVHVAQQIRRDKLRILNSNSQHLQEFPNNQLEQLSPQQGLNLDLLQVRNVRNGNNNNNNMLDEPPAQALYSSEMITLSTASNPLSVELGSAEVPYRLMIMPHHYGSFPHSSSSIHNSSPKEQQCEPRGNLGNWRNSGPHDWMVNYATSSVANQSNNPHSFLANELNNDSNVPTHHQHYMKPSCHNNVLTDVQSSQNSTCGEMHYPNSSSSNSLYQNALQDMASLMHQAGHGTWGGKNNAGEPVLHHPIYGGIANLWTNRSVDNSSLRWSSPLGFTDKKVNDSNPHQGLSLSLSSNSQSRPCGEGSASDHDPHQSRSNISKDHQYAKYVKSNTMMKPSNNVSRDCGKSLQDPMGLPPPNTSYSSVGPLGPFTGYATILKSSRFLKPCQQLLDEYCSQCGPKLAKACDVPEWVFRDVSASTTSANAVNVDERGVAEKGSSNAGASSSMFYDSMDNSTDGGAASNFSLSSRPECQKNKAKLLYMQEEVTRRYKQYHQQMQMVVSSFESVAGLNSATPCISLALKLVSRHFRCLKNAISDQLKLICEALGEALSMPTTSASSKFDTNMARLRCMDQSFQRNKSGNMDFVEPQQHVWRPQRGLPERSVAILKAWLFEHFLHPYPTDTDKHMLATQTGLSRNQVSNWFINARVRVWKPMVEEIHMLETKVMVGADRSSSKNEGTSASEGSSSHPRVDQSLNNKFGTHAANAIPEKQFRCFEMGSSSLASANDQENGLSHEEEQWSREKRSKLECQNITSGMDGTLMGFIPFRRGSLEVGGLGPVSLTLGLRHGVEGAQQQQQQQQQLQHEEQLRHHFGGRMIHDFVG